MSTPLVAAVIAAVRRMELVAVTAGTLTWNDIVPEPCAPAAADCAAGVAPPPPPPQPVRTAMSRRAVERRIRIRRGSLNRASYQANAPSHLESIRQAVDETVPPVNRVPRAKRVARRSTDQA